MTEYLCLYIKDINLGAINMYRPPSASTESFSNSLDQISKWMTKIEKEFSEARFIITGDFNINEMKT